MVRSMLYALLDKDVQDGAEIVLSVSRKPTHNDPARVPSTDWYIRVTHKEKAGACPHVANVQFHRGGYLPKQVLRRALAELLKVME
jgi:hypothetical protein